MPIETPGIWIHLDDCEADHLDGGENQARPGGWRGYAPNHEHYGVLDGAGAWIARNDCTAVHDGHKEEMAVMGGYRSVPEPEKFGCPIRHEHFTLPETPGTWVPFLACDQAHDSGREGERVAGGWRNGSSASRLTHDHFVPAPAEPYWPLGSEQAGDWVLVSNCHEQHPVTLERRFRDGGWAGSGVDHRHFRPLTLTTDNTRARFEPTLGSGEQFRRLFLPEWRNGVWGAHHPTQTARRDAGMPPHPVDAPASWQGVEPTFSILDEAHEFAGEMVRDPHRSHSAKLTIEDSDGEQLVSLSITGKPEIVNHVLTWAADAVKDHALGE